MLADRGQNFAGDPAAELCSLGLVAANHNLVHAGLGDDGRLLGPAQRVEDGVRLAYPIVQPL